MHFLDFLQSSFNWLLVVDVAVKASLLLGTAALLTSLLRRSSAASRHLVWTCALLAALALPLLSIALPRWHVPIVTLREVTAVAPDARPYPAGSAPAVSGADSQRSARTPGISDRPAQRSASTLSDAPAPAMFSSISWSTLLGITWMTGVALILGRLAVGILAVQLLARRTEKVTDAAWLPLARQIASQLGLSRVAFRRSERPAMPMAWGIFRPSVLMPADADGWSQDRLRIVLLHELAHVRRADCLTHLLAQVACAFYWMNPLAWMAARRLRTERERACDDLVLSAGTAGPDYADQLLEIARTLGSRRFSPIMAGASLAMAQRSQLEGRLMSILDPSVPRTGLSRVRAATAIVIACCAIVPLASLQPWGDAEAAVLPQLPINQAASTPPLAPAPQPSTTVRQAMPSESETQGAGQKVATAIAQGVAEGALQGVTEGVLQSVIQSVPAAISGALEGGFSQQPHPNPDPGPHSAQSKADPKVVAALTEALKDTDKEVRESALQALVQMRDPGIFDPLVQALKDASPDVRENAAFGLGQLRDKRAVAPLTGALKDAAPNVREQAAFALGRLRDPATVDGLVGALRDENANVREQAAFALGQIRDERAVEPLVALVKDPAENVREQAVFALGQLRSRSAVDALIVALKDADAEIRGQAAFALGQIRDPRAIDALTSALKDTSAEVRQQAAFALGQLAR